MGQDKRYVVPEGMLKAAEAASEYVSYEPAAHRMRFGSLVVISILEAVLRWLAENPIVPSESQAFSMAVDKDKFPFDKWEWVRWGACEWQRRMFLAPEPEAEMDSTPNHILELRQILYDLTNRPEETSLPLVAESIERTLRALGDEPPEPKVPEGIKDLLWEEVGFAGFTNDRQAYNEAISEAFRRGQRAKVKP